MDNYNATMDAIREHWRAVREAESQRQKERERAEYLKTINDPELREEVSENND